MNENHFAVVVGITHYPGGFSTLSGPVNDAQAFYDWLIDPAHGNVPVANVKLITTPADPVNMVIRDAEPTHDGIDRALWEMVQAAGGKLDGVPLAKRAAVRSDMRLYVYVAGHGIMPSGGRAALLTAQAEPGRAVNVDLLAYQLWYENDGRFGEMCIFVDCCRSYEPLAPHGGPKFGTAMRHVGHVYTVVGYAAEAGQVANEETDVPADLRRGYFSKALVAGLSGEARDEASGYVTSVSLSDYLHRQVPELTRELGEYKRQAVDMTMNPAIPMRFGPQRVLPTAGKEHPVTIRFPAGFTGEVELRYPQDMRVPYRAASGPWTLELPEGIYMVVHPGGYHTDGFANQGIFTVTGALNVQL